MSTLLFVAQVSREPGSGYAAAFPDLPGCAAHAPDMAALLVAARAAVLARLQALSDAGEAWPRPTPIEQASPVDGAIPILVDVAVDDPPVRVNISLGERLLARLDAAAEARSMTRSGFITHAVRVSLGERPAPQASFDGQRLQDELNSLGRRINESIGPDSAFSRRMAEFDGYVFDGVRKAADSVSAAMARRQKPAGADEPPPQA